MIKSLFFISLAAIEVDVPERRRAKLYPELLVFAMEARDGGKQTPPLIKHPRGMKTDSQGRRRGEAPPPRPRLMRDGVYGPPPVHTRFH